MIARENASLIMSKKNNTISNSKKIKTSSAAVVISTSGVIQTDVSAVNGKETVYKVNPRTHR